jgi:hypothetical protein
LTVADVLDGQALIHLKVSHRGRVCPPLAFSS